MRQIIIGAGEVGKAVFEVLDSAYDDVWLRDIEPSGPTEADVIHVCFGWSVSFIDNVRAYMREYKPSLVIVHSTVAVGTCDHLGVVHSPVRGQHPKLAEGIRRFVKYFGGLEAQRAADIFEKAGVDTRVLPRAAETEAGKLWELTQYGIAIAVEKAIHAYCEERCLDFQTVYTEFAETYNEGYAWLEQPEFIRPVLKHVPGPIGGHCVVPGAKLLSRGGDWSTLADLVINAGADE